MRSGSSNELVQFVEDSGQALPATKETLHTGAPANERERRSAEHRWIDSSALGLTHRSKGDIAKEPEHAALIRVDAAGVLGYAASRGDGLMAAIRRV
jgi:hypothetical protein